MSLNESIVADAALESFLLRSAPLNFGGQVGDQPLLAAISAALRLPRGEEEEREAIRRLNPALSGPVFQQECRTLFNLWLPN
ncbi:MAG: hypothetical protein NTV80_20530 [Verrucomicrobia bacterium]|nr:hypothetical protein [Verrucomicrobiota bacterium]